MSFVGLNAQNVLINVEYNSGSNCVSASIQECSPFIVASASIENCECRKNCSEIEPSEEDYIKFEECLDECKEDHDDPVYEDYCLDGCEFELYSSERRCYEDCDPPIPIRCKPCRITYRLIADFAKIPLDPRTHAGNRYVSPIFTSGGLPSGGCRVNCGPDSDNEPIEFECFELPSNWQELSEGNNVCYGIEVLSIQFIQCGDSECPVGLQGSEWNCLIIG